MTGLKLLPFLVLLRENHQKDKITPHHTPTRRHTHTHTHTQTRVNELIKVSNLQSQNLSKYLLADSTLLCNDNMNSILVKEVNMMGRGV